MYFVANSFLLALAGQALCAQYFIAIDDHLPKTPIIGIALSVDHVTYSARYNNGSFHDLGRIEAGEDYVGLMRRLSLPSSSHPTPPYQKPEQAFNDIPRQWWRNFRRRLGLPASSDVGILAELLEHVVEAVSPLMGDQKAAVISFPDLPALYQEDILDAAGFVGLLALQVEKWEKVQPQKHVAAFAGYGLGLCEDYKNWTKCHEEAAIMPWRHVVLFDYTKSALLLHHRYYKTAWVDRALQFDMASSFDLGSTKDANEGDIRDFVLQFMRRYIWPHEGMVVDFILTGEPENYRDGKALRAIEEAADIVGSTVEAFFSNPDYVAARGATEMAFRSSQGGE